MHSVDTHHTEVVPAGLVAASLEVARTSPALSEAEVAKMTVEPGIQD